MSRRCSLLIRKKNFIQEKNEKTPLLTCRIGVVRWGGILLEVSSSSSSVKSTTTWGAVVDVDGSGAGGGGSGGIDWELATVAVFVAAVGFLLVTAAAATIFAGKRGIICCNVELDGVCIELERVLELRVAVCGPLVFVVCELIVGITINFCCCDDILLLLCTIKSVCICESCRLSFNVCCSRSIFLIFNNFWSLFCW